MDRWAVYTLFCPSKISNDELEADNDIEIVRKFERRTKINRRHFEARNISGESCKSNYGRCSCCAPVCQSKVLL
jgi:hypothetical protein